MNRLASISCVSMALAVALGALAAHFLKDALAPNSLMSFQTGVRYHIYHSLALLVIGIYGPSDRFRKPWWLMFVGMAFFSLSIYGLSTREVFNLAGQLKWLGPITPLGGLMMIGAWLWFAIVFLKTPHRSSAD